MSKSPVWINLHWIVYALGKGRSGVFRSGSKEADSEMRIRELVMDQERAPGREKYRREWREIPWGSEEKYLREWRKGNRRESHSGMCFGPCPREGASTWPCCRELWNEPKLEALILTRGACCWPSEQSSWALATEVQPRPWPGEGRTNG